jgi:DNA-binding response OmpR family regulator
VDDDRLLADLVCFAFQRRGYAVVQAHDGETALQRWESEKPDLIVLDVNLPGRDGFAICEHIRQHAATPIIMLTVRSEEDDVVRGLDIGADDYLSKPFSPRQLLARAEATLRRAKSDLRPFGERHINPGGVAHDPSRREVRVGNGAPIRLAPLESKLLEYLLVNAGITVTTEAIIDHIWGPQGGDSDMIRQLIYRLRTKLESESAGPRYIENVPGIGYSFVLVPGDEAH